MQDGRSLGRFIAKRRKQIGITQAELASWVGVSKSAIAKWETDGGIPDRDNLRKLSEVLGISVEGLYGVIGGKEADTSEVNITADLIAVLEQNGYRVIKKEKNDG